MSISNDITVNNIRISYSATGSGTPIILLHGWACNQQFWKNQLYSLSKKHQVLTPDFRGHGLSEKSEEGCNIANLAEDIHVMIENLDIRPAVIIGHSMGGMVAQQLAITHPHDFSALGLIATAASDPEHQLISVRIYDETSEIGYHAALTRHFPAWFSENATSDMKDWIRVQMMKTSERVALAMINDYRNLDYRDELSKIRIPTLVIGASSDTSTTVTRSKEIADLIPEAKFVAIAGSGHFVQLEQPTKINQEINIFLTEHSL